MDGNSKSFTFSTITYNHHLYIIEHLESIKYQVQNYLVGWNIYLVVSDDHSDDNTIKITKEWVSLNKSLFKSYKIIENSRKKGIVGNYVNALDNIETNLFSLKAGDDLYNYLDINSVICKLEINDIVQSSLIMFNEKSFFLGENAYNLFIDFYKRDRNSILNILRNNRRIMIAPSFFFQKKLYTESLRDYLLRFNYSEDKNLFYYLIRNNKDLTVSFDQNPVVLYRRHSNNSTLIQQVSTSLVEDDRMYLISLDSLNCFQRFSTIRELKNNHSFVCKILDVVFIWNKFEFYFRKIMFYHLYKRYLRNIEKSIELSISFYESIKKNIK